MSLILLALAATAGVRVRFAPKFVSGEILRYRIESRTTTTGKTTTPIVNPEGGSQSNQAIHMVVRLETLSVSPDGKVRFRATYEKSSAESETDALDLQASAFADQYNHLEGRSVDFALQPDGQFTEFKDVGAAPAGQPNGAQPDAGTPTAAQSVPGHAGNETPLAWLQGVLSDGTFPQKGVTIGQKWNSEQPIPNALLSGLIRRTDSSYLRNEPCASPAESKASADQAGARPDDCAVILTRFETLRRGATGSDATPEDYRRNGLRTSGTWVGSGESLDSISLSTGLLITSTRTSTQDMDYRITSASTGSSIHHVGKVKSQSEIAFMPDRP